MSPKQILTSLCITGFAYVLAHILWSRLPQRFKEWRYQLVTGSVKAELTNSAEESLTEISLYRGTRLWIECQAALEAGQICINLLDPAGALVQSTCLQADGKDKLLMAALADGTYILRVDSEDATGSYVIKWSSQRLVA